MTTKKFEDLSSFELDILGEIGNIGSGNAATALSQILSNRVSMSVPQLRIVDLDDVPYCLGGPENPVIGILLNMSGDISGMIMFIIEKDFINTILTSLIDKEINKFGELEEIQISVFKEVGNILAGSYVNALSKLTGLNIMISPPDLATDMAGAIMSLPAAVFGMVSDKAVIMQQDFYGEDRLTSHLIFVPELHSLNLILGKLGVI